MRQRTYSSSPSTRCRGESIAGVITGYLAGTRVIVFDVSDARRLYAEGFYGKPLGIPKPRSADFDAPLELDLVEALYLVEKGVLRVVDADGREYSRDELETYARVHVPKFDPLYRVYRELRDAGYVVRSGLKFGSDFAVYIHGPGIDHAPFLVTVVEYEESIDPLEIVRAGRLSHSVRKHFVIAAVDRRSGKVSYLAFSWMRV